MPARPTALRLLIALFILLPFKTVAQISLAAAAVVFLWQPFELSRLYALVAVSVVQLLARLHRWMESQRAEDEARRLAPALVLLDRLGRVYDARHGFGTSHPLEVAARIVAEGAAAALPQRRTPPRKVKRARITIDS